MERDWFEVDEKGIVHLRNEAKNIPDLKILLKDKEHTQYIWHLCHHKSPYSSYEEIEREQMVREDYLKGEFPTRDVVLLADKYKKTLETTSMRLLRAAKQAALNIAEYLEGESKKDKGEQDIVNVTKVLEKIGKIIESLDKLDERVKKEITNEEKIRGGGEVRSRER